MAHAPAGFAAGAGDEHFVIAPERAVKKQRIRLQGAGANRLGHRAAAGDVEQALAGGGGDGQADDGGLRVKAGEARSGLLIEGNFSGHGKGFQR